MKYIILFVLVLFSVSAYSQIEDTPLFVGKYFGNQSGGGSGYWQVTGNFTDESGYYDATSIQIGDILFFVDAGIGYHLPVTSIISASGSSFTIRVNNTGISGVTGVPNGPGGIYRSNSPKGIWPFTAGLTASDQQTLNSFLIKRLNNEPVKRDTFITVPHSTNYIPNLVIETPSRFYNNIYLSCKGISDTSTVAFLAAPTSSHYGVVYNVKNDSGLVETRVLSDAHFSNTKTSYLLRPGQMAQVRALKDQRQSGAYKWAVNLLWDSTATGGGSGITALTGDVTASGTGSVAATIANNAVDSTKAANLSPSDLAQTGASTGQVLTWTGSKYAPRNVSGGGSANLQDVTTIGDSTTIGIKIKKAQTTTTIKDSVGVSTQFRSTTGTEGIVLENIRTEKYGNVYTSPYTSTTYRMGEWNRFLTRNWYNPGSNRPGEVLTMDSYNASRVGGRLFTDEASWANVFESHYEQNRDQFEYYQQTILRDGYSFRPFSMYIGKKDSTNDTRFQSHIFHIAPVGIEADMLNLKNGSLQLSRQATATPATPGQTWTELVMAESTSPGNTFTVSNTGGNVTFTQTAAGSYYSFDKTILGTTSVNLGASGGALGKAFLQDLRLTNIATVTSYPQFTLRLDDATNDVVRQKSSLIGTNASEDLIFFNSGNIRGTIDLLGKYYFGVTSERVATDAFLDVQGHNQTSTTGPPTTGTNSKAVLRLSSRITTAVLDMGLSSNAHAYIQATLSGNLASNRELRLNPNGGNVAIGNSTTDNSLYKLFVNGAVGANNVSVGTNASPTARLHLGAGTATANTAPLKYTSGTLMTTPEAGATEYDGTEFYATNSTASRTILARVLKGSATLDFSSTAAGAVTDLTITVTGAADGDVVSLSVPNASQTTTGSFSAWVSAANTVTVRYRIAALVGSEDPASGTFKVTVTK